MSAQEKATLDAQALQEFRKQQNQLVEKTVARLMEAKADFAHMGDKAESKMLAGFGFINRMLETTMEFDEIAIMEHQLEWSANRLPHDGVPMPIMIKTLHVYRQVIEENLSAESSQRIGQQLEWMVSWLEKAASGKAPE